MPFLVLTRRNREDFTDAEAEALFPAEAVAVAALRRAGFVRGVWDRADVAGVCLLVDASDEKAVRAELAKLPLFRAGMVSIETLVPLAARSASC